MGKTIKLEKGLGKQQKAKCSRRKHRTLGKSAWHGWSHFPSQPFHNRNSFQQSKTPICEAKLLEQADGSTIAQENRSQRLC